MEREFAAKLKECASIPDIFELVKDSVWKSIRKSRAGLELGLAEMGNQQGGLLGAYYVSGSNIIMMNETPLRRIQETNPELLTPYIFSILLHEYLHSLGFFDEDYVRKAAYGISCEIFGSSNVVSQISKDLSKFFPFITYPQGAPSVDSPVRKVADFDRSSIRYIG